MKKKNLFGRLTLVFCTCLMLTIGMIPSATAGSMSRKEAEKLYSPVLDMYYYNIKTGWKHFKRKERYDTVKRTYDLNFISGDGVLPHNITKPGLRDVGYVFRDLDSDGTPELLIGTWGLNELYTIRKGKFYHLASSFDRDSYALCEDGTLVHSYLSEGMGEYHLYLKKGAKKLSVMEAVYDDFYNGVFYQSNKEFRTKYYDVDYNKLTEITEDDYNQIKNSWPKTSYYPKDLGFRYFKKYKPISKKPVYQITSKVKSKH